MVIFPWLVLVTATLALAAALLTVASLFWTRRGAPAPFTVGLVSTLVVALPLLLAILAWGLFVKPR